MDGANTSSPVLTLGYAATKEQTNAEAVRELMQNGMDASGKPITDDRMTYFDEHSKKDLSELVNELNAGEVELYIHPKTRRVHSKRFTVKIILIDPVHNKYIAEWAHTYRGQKLFDASKIRRNELPQDVKKTDERYSFSETMIAGETDVQTMARCLQQEAGLSFSEYEIHSAIKYRKPGLKNHHESKTYAYIYSEEYIRAIFTVTSTALDPNKLPPMYDDNGKFSLRTWEDCFPIDEKETVGQLRERGYDF